ncbi:hypothetical protein SS1G_05842 [Sclerotinia sclerotiorum 1980 UF-70]|uniref:RBR-type E3 ubiquitin transferase n=1 Tax=Sclerotinia sclerotiorum (strain ATCC 18683 / 1980 / Ss-1) TaxID=665079 RepID=A7EKJ5_SCLS1|nr:hypothetical protein SS1G_05842 [Sclerotinia sclerotiorum 1980 UF-70]EDO03361.1 hypothetical protein SS1G_05842 [Sclerotinia sclerotiorum 1980 UF-70]
MADSLTSGSTRTVLSDTASPGYLNNANLSEFPAPPTINIKDEGTPEPQVDAIDMENPPESDVKAKEYGSTDRTYCANTDCLAFITKKSIQGNKAFCTKSPCDTVSCVKCKGKWHEGDCPADEALEMVLAEAKKHSWKRCAKCGALIEHTEGCAQMKCQCGHQFCYCCNATWRTCYCTQDKLDHTLGVTHPYTDNENVIEYGENNEEGLSILGGRVGTNIIANNPFENDTSQTSQRNTGLWSNNRLDGQTDKPSAEALGARFQQEMHRLRDYIRSIEHRADNHENTTSSTLTPATNQDLNVTPDKNLDTEPSLSINYSTNHGNNINTTPTSNRNPLLPLRTSNPSSNTQTDTYTQPMNQQSELSSTSAVSSQIYDTADNINNISLARRINAMMMRRRQIQAIMIHDWAAREFFLN